MKESSRLCLGCLALITAALCTVAEAQTNCLTPPSGLIAWWRAEGNATNSAGEIDDVLYNGTTYAAGKVGEAFSFDGIQNCVTNDTPGITNVLNSYTVEFWAWPTAGRASTAEQTSGIEGNSGQRYAIFPGFGGVGNVGSGVSVGTNGISVFEHGYAYLPSLLVYDAPITGWTHIAVVYQNQQPSLYVNGALVRVGLTSLRNSYPSTWLGEWGAQSLNYGFYAGLLDEVSIYNRALSPSEIGAIYQAGSSGKCAVPVPPVVLAQPAAETVMVGQVATFSVAVAGTRPLSFQWMFDGTDLAGASTSTLVLTNVQLSQAGNYTVEITNAVGSVLSSAATLTVTSAPPCVSPPAGLVGWWRGESNAWDQIGGNNGSFLNGPQFDPGEVGLAFNFDGTGNYVTVPPSPSLDVGQGPGLTVEAWIKPGDLSSGRPIFEWALPNAYGVHFWVNTPSSGCLYANLADTAGNLHIIQSAPGVLMANTDQHVAITYDKASGTAQLFVNGSVVQTTVLGTFTPRTSSDVYIGYRPVGSPYGPVAFVGLIDEVSLYNRALTSAEIQSIYSAGPSGKCVVPLPPTFVTQPLNIATKIGNNATFSAVVQGSPLLSYQWYYNGAALVGATNARLTVTNVQTTNDGNYSLLVTNAYGSTLSSNALLDVRVVFAFANGQMLTNSQYLLPAPILITLQNAYSNNLLFYTLDGSTPTFGSRQYTSGFSLAQSAILRAVAYSSDFSESWQLAPINISIIPTYTLNALRTGGGTITLNPNNQPYLSNTVVSVTAVPNSGWRFLQWLGDATGTNTTMSLVMTGTRWVQAVFGTTLSTTTAGGGAVVTSPSPGVYPYGAQVQITAVPQSGNYFGIWGNAASGNSNPLFFSVTNANPTVSALFASLPSGQVGLTVIPTGIGTVSVSPRANAYSIGQAVSLLAVPSSSQKFLGWSGDVTNAQNPLVLSMNTSKVVYANFTHDPVLLLPAGLTGVKPQGFSFVVSGDYGAVFQLMGTTNFLNWSGLGSVTNFYGVVQFMDFSAPTYPQRFYRALEAP